MFDLIPMGNREKNIWGYLDNLERTFFQNAMPSVGQLQIDVVDEGSRYVLHADLPGFRKEDIDIQIDGGYLTIQARQDEQKEEKQENYVRRERRVGSYSRSFDVSDIKADAITAKYENGVLTLDLPKMENPVPPARQISIQ